MTLARKRTILAVDDDQKTRQLLKLYLEKHQYVVQLAADGASFRSGFERYRDDLSLVILDVMLPDTDGFALCQMVRQRAPTLPIIMLTASADDTERIVGLELGADDYVPKPFEMRELLARARAVLRRLKASQPAAAAQAVESRRVQFGVCQLDLDERRLFGVDSNEIEISAAEFDLLSLFARNPNRPLNRDQIMEQAHNRGWDVFDRSIDLRVMRLRRKIESNPDKPEVLKTVRNVGYVFVPHVADA
jgi:two-component system phosphate regulon response regulator OmpR